MRSVETWQGATDDAKIPDRVKLRIWQREGGKCSLTGRKIMPGDKYEFEHRLALCNGGSHSEDNIVLVLAGKVHREKTARDVKVRAKTDRMAKKHAGIRKPSRLTHPTLKRGCDGKVRSRSVVERGQG